MSTATARDPPPASNQETGLQKAKTNLTYLALGSGAAAAPSSLATRSFLTTTRYVPCPFFLHLFPTSLEHV